MAIHSLNGISCCLTFTWRPSEGKGVVWGEHMCVLGSAGVALSHPPPPCATHHRKALLAFIMQDFASVKFVSLF